MENTENWFTRNPDLVNTKAWDGEYTDPEAGDYEAVVTKLAQEPSSKQGIPMLVVTSELFARADGSDTDQRGKKVFNRYPMTGKGVSRLRAFLDATGVQISADGDYDAGTSIGAHYLLSVYKEPYKTKDGKDGIGTRVFRERAMNGHNR